MSESKTEYGPSLLPYLDSTHGGLHIDIPALRASDPVPIEATGPFAALYEGIVSTGVDKGLAQMLMLVQPDRYPPVSSELDPITNVQVEQLWQSAAERFSGMPQPNTFPAILDEQIDDQGRLVPMRPIFHCRHRDRWCHPRCPHCGEPLRLCRDDQALRDAGLPGYTLSLDRFLYCIRCAAQPEGPLFYASEPADESSAALNGCNHLIEGFSRLIARQDLAGKLPCVGCPESTNCYGPETLVLERMKPVFFFPFHMLLMPAATFNLKEFAALLSGRKGEDILKGLNATAKPGRARVFERRLSELPSSEGLLFGGDERRFLEVLYLKLTLLTALCELIPFEEDRVSQPVGSMSLESIWVDLPVQNAHLPLFWNFSLRLIDPVGYVADRWTQGPVTQGRRRHFLGAAWCSLLLDGAGQAMAAILAAVGKLIQEPALLTQESDGDIVLEKIDPLFAPHHLMADAGETSIPTGYAKLWQRALLMGCRMLKAGHDAGGTWQEAAFQQELDRLREEIRQTLFAAVPAASAAEKTADTGNDAAIAAILDSILRSWPPGGAAGEEKTSFSSKLLKSQAPPSPASDDDGDYVETVILGKDAYPGGLEETASGAPLQMDETVVAHPTEASADAPAAPSALDATVVIQRDSDDKKTSAWEDLEKTVVLPSSQEQAAPDDDLEETVVLGSPTAGGHQSPGRETGAASESDLEETVVQGAPSQGRGAGPGSTPGTERERHAREEDDLEKTVVIHPSTNKKEKPES